MEQKSAGVLARPHPDQHFGCVTYAQHGEDILFLNIFKLLGVEKGTYLDIGAHHPEIISNTKLLYERGWRGVNVDANLNVMADFERERPEDLNVNVAVSTSEGTADLYLYAPRSGRNTISPAEVERMRDWAAPRDRQRVQTTTINKLIDTCFATKKFPHLLSVDIEGLDYDVLSTADFERYGAPMVICVETRFMDTPRMERLLYFRGFSLYVRLGENLIFVGTDYWKKLFGV